MQLLFYTFLSKQSKEKLSEKQRIKIKERNMFFKKHFIENSVNFLLNF